MKEVFRTKYLNSKLEPLKKVEPKYERELVSDFYQFAEHSYSEESGNFEVELGETKISMSYSKPDFIETYRNVIKSKDTYITRAVHIFRNIRTLDSVVIGKDGHSLDMSVIFPGGKVYFNMDKGMKTSSCVDTEDKIIFLEDDPMTPEGLLTLLHEIGHYQDSLRISENENNARYEARTNLDSKKKQLVHNEWEGILLLKDERAAWAFALNNLRPFIEDLEFNLNGVEDEVHNHCLQSYSNYIRNKINA